MMQSKSKCNRSNILIVLFLFVRYWALLKQRFRRILLQKMLQTPSSKETPLKDALKEAFQHTPDEPVVKFVRMGLRQLREAANEIRRERNEEEVSDYDEEL